MSSESRIIRYADYTGMLSSLLCLVHCMVLPVAAFAFGITEMHDRHDNHTNVVFLVLSAMSALLVGRRSSMAIRISLCVSLLLIITLLGAKHLMQGPVWLSYLGYGASLGLIITHFIHLKSCKDHACCTHQ